MTLRIKSIFILIISLLLIGITATAQRTMTVGNGIGKIPYFTCPSKGEMRFPVILVTYQDVPLLETEEKAIKHFDDFFNKEGYDWNGATGSVRDYFIAASAGRFAPQFDILGVVQLANNRLYYGDGSGTAGGHPDEMVIEGVKAMAGKVDFAVYDSDSDMEVDNVIVVYAGNAERFGTGDEAVLPTSFLIRFDKYDEEGFTYGYEQDGLFFNSYTVTSELAYGKYDGIGTFLHEFSHALGLADEYNIYDPYGTYTPQKYDLMDAGLYNNSSRTPPTYSAFERYTLGWIDLEVIDGPCELELDALNTSNKGYIIPVSENEFFILENRQKQGWDKYLPGHGLMVWHIDYDYDSWYNNLANYYKSHQRIKLINNIKDKLILAPWNDSDLGLTITEITETGGRIKVVVTGSNGITQQYNDYAITVSGRTITSPSTFTLFDTSGRIIGIGRSVTVSSRGVYIVKTASGNIVKMNIKF